MKWRYSSRFLAGLLLQILFSFASFSSGHLVLAFFGALLTAASLGLLPGLCTALLAGGAFSCLMESERFFMLPVDFLFVFVTAYAVRHSWFGSWRRVILLGLGVGFVGGLFAFGLASCLEFPLADSIMKGTWLTEGMLETHVQLLLSGIYHAADVAISFLLIEGLRHLVPSFFLLEIADVSKEGVRRFPIRVKLLVILSLVMVLTASLLFFCVRGVYRQQIIETYGAVARNFVEAASLLVDERELPVILAPGGSETDAYRELFSNMRAFYARSDDIIRYMNLYAVGTQDGRGYAMTICDPSDTGYRYGRTFWMDEDAYYDEIGKQMLDPKDNRMIGPVVSRGYWGWLMTIYKPLYDPDGKKVAFIGIDLDMTRAMQEMRVLDTKMLSIEFIIFSLLLALMYRIITQQVIDPVRRLQEMLGYFREHREKSPVEEAPTSGDEFEVLAHDITEVQDIILQDSEQLQEYLDLIQRMALRDELTGVQNHTAYENKLSELTAVITAGTAEFAILMADMNGLKFVNDVYGHEKGDIALRAMSRALCDIFKHSPVYRIGGDEFVVVLTGRDYENRDALLGELAPYERVRNRAAAEPWTEVAMAVGCSVYDPLQDRDYQDVFNRADETMYENKRRIKKEAGEL